MGNTPVITGTMADFLAAKKLHQKTEEDFQAGRKRSLIDLIGLLFGAIPELTEIIVKGYTPGFNDGDPCTHSQMDPYINGTDMYGDRDDEDDSDPDGEGDNNEVAKTKEISNENREIVASEVDRLSGVLESLFGTNWKITIKRQGDGTITWEQEDYDCGY